MEKRLRKEEDASATPSTSPTKVVPAHSTEIRERDRRGCRSYFAAQIPKQDHQSQKEDIPGKTEKSFIFPSRRHGFPSFPFSRREITEKPKK
jgi:hypothetical protein